MVQARDGCDVIGGHPAQASGHEAVASLISRTQQRNHLDRSGCVTQVPASAQCRRCADLIE